MFLKLQELISILLNSLFFTDRNIGWRGRNYGGAPVPDGTYYYLIKIKKYEDYNKSNFTIESYKGSLILVGSNN
jgi:hypothetical protein